MSLIARVSETEESNENDQGTEQDSTDEQANTANATDAFAGDEPVTVQIPSNLDVDLDASYIVSAAIASIVAAYVTNKVMQNG